MVSDVASSPDYGLPERWRKKPVEIEAMRTSVDTAPAVLAWVRQNGGVAFQTTTALTPDGGMVIVTWEGDMQALPGDWIIRGVQGEFYPCKPDIFEATYERVFPSDVGAP